MRILSSRTVSAEFFRLLTALVERKRAKSLRRPPSKYSMKHFAIVTTANHYWLDAAIGGTLVALVLTSDKKVVELVRNLARERSIDGVVPEPLSY